MVATWGWHDRALRIIAATSGAAWDPTQPLPDSGLLPHTWHYVYAGLASPVAAMVNQGTDVHTIAQGVGANQPTIAAGFLNGEDVLSFDGTDWLQGAFGGGAIAQPNTAFIVFKLLNPGDDNYYFVLDGDDVASRLYVGQYRPGDNWGVYSGAWLLGSATDSDWHTMTILSNGAASSFWLEGVLDAVGNAGVQSLDGITLGAERAGSFDWVGYCADVLIYDANLSDADKNTVGNYLATRYALAYTDI